MWLPWYWHISCIDCIAMIWLILETTNDFSSLANLFLLSPVRLHL